MYKLILPAVVAVALATLSFTVGKNWQSRFVKISHNGVLTYVADEKGATLPDFSRVGYYHGDQDPPQVPVVITVAPGPDAEARIQAALDAVSQKPLRADGFRGAVLLKKGRYVIQQQLRIRSSGVVLRGEGDATQLIAAGTDKRALIDVSGSGAIRPVPDTRTRITDAFVPVGATSFSVASAKGFRPGDRIIVFRPGTAQWIQDLKMDRIDARDGTKQWTPTEYNLQFEREVTRVSGNTIYIDNPVVMEMEPKYGVAEIYKYTFEGRLSQVGVEALYCESEYTADTAENHSWDAVAFDKIENGWVKGVTAKYFAYSCVNLSPGAKNISVLQSNCFEHKSVITGGRRYSFNNDGQQNLFIDCHATDGRHDFVTGARTLGPNVFYNCTARRTHADIGPHHRWSAGTLYDNVVTDGEINIQDRGNYGSGHGWVGITQVLWNCTAKKAAVQSPYVNGKNYSIGLKGEKAPGRFKDRPDGVWEGQNQEGLEPSSLYKAQLRARQGKR